MQKWTADFVNDPLDDYNLIVEVLYEDKDVAVIRNISGEVVVKWYPRANELDIPVEWLIGLLTDAKRRLSEQ